MSTVSVIVPCYKYGAYVTDCVTSLLTNTEVDLDILVIDDASPDDSWSVVADLPKRDSRIRVQRNEHNRGLIPTANTAVMETTADYVVLLSADDAHAPGWLDRGVGFLERNPEAVLAYGPTRRFSGALPSTDQTRAVKPVVHRGRDWIAHLCAQGSPALFSPEAIVRTSTHHAVGGYRADLPYSSDMEMWLRLATVGDVIFVGGPVAAYYRVSAASMSSTANVNLLSDPTFRLDAFTAWHEFADGRLSGHDELLGQAKRALAQRAMRQASVALFEDPRSEDVDSLCAFALDCDPAVAGRVDRLRSLRSRTWARRVLRGMRPVSRTGFRAYRAVDEFRYRMRAR